MQRTLLILAAGGSAALLLGAFAFQYIGGLAPCALCIDQRYPHAVAVVIGVAGLATGWRLLALPGALAAATTAGIGIYHTGAERGWWTGPSTCTSGPVEGMDTDALFDQIMAAPIVRCNDVAWSLAGLSMASWNALLSAGLVVVWLLVLRRPQR